MAGRGLRGINLVGLGVVLCLSPWDEAFCGEMITVAPKVSDAILANPKVGWETFHRPADQDKNLPSWIPSTVHYARWGWGRLEPRPGQIAYAFLDEELKRSRAAGQTYAFRVMCCSTSPRTPYHPPWLREKGGRVVQTRYGGEPTLDVPDLDDPVVLKAHLDFIRRLGARYDGHPDLAHVDLGSVGWWGEWHMSQSSDLKMPSLATRKKIVDAYLAAFKKTPLLMLVGGREMLKYAVAQGTGWRADCLGDMGGFSKRWCHMRMGYPQMLSSAQALDAWKRAPVAWESCWDMRKWVDEGWSLRFIFNYALALHGSFINNKSVPLPEGEEVRREVERFLRRLGYRFVLKQLRHPATVRAGGTLTLTMRWQNTGSAPCYDPYRLAYRLSNDRGYQKVFVSTVTVDRWMPGEIPVFTKEFLREPPDLPPGPIVAVTDTVVLPRDMPSGDYRLSLAVVGSRTDTPIVQLGIQGRAGDGWYPLSRVHVSR
ncbi:MAG TPA: DUF4832 domain-containing protein [Planctomycetaceae bacterium]|nr:DUF4832 domain-containing protein [Planctomycetaceae bacterium]